MVTYAVELLKEDPVRAHDIIKIMKHENKVEMPYRLF